MGPRKTNPSKDMDISPADDDGGVMISIPNDQLYHDLSQHNSYFDTLVDMIPAKLYISGNTGDEMYNPKYKKGQYKESKEARRARNKAAKQKKFHPELSETTREAKARMAREEQEEMDSSDSDDGENEDNAVDKAGKKRRMKQKAAAKSKKAGAWANDSDDDGGDDDVMASTPDLSNERAVDRTGGTGTEAAVPAGTSRIEALRAKLRAKIAERQANRPGGAPAAAGGGGAAPDAISKRAARRAEKKRRIEAAKKRAESVGSTRVGKNEAPTKKYKVSQDHLGGTSINTGRGADASKEEDLAGVDFGGIAGLTKKAAYLDNKSLAKSGGKKKSLDRLLADAEKKRDRLKELKTGTEEDKEKAKRIMWGDTLKEASGERVRDDPALIKKAMKRKAKKKVKSAKAWEARTEQLKDARDERQKIRSHNLDKRKLGGAIAANLSHKRIVTEDDKEENGGNEKRARLGPYAAAGKERAGFEGKRSTFINDPKRKGKKGNQ